MVVVDPGVQGLDIGAYLALRPFHGEQGRKHLVQTLPPEKVKDSSRKVFAPARNLLQQDLHRDLLQRPGADQLLRKDFRNFL